ncbi:MAG TPA: FAD-binding protein [Devosia sp.]|nr:FAD-binding protein [Devosia sp.]
MNHITHNWAEHIAFAAGHTHYPRTVEAVQEAVALAPKLRPIGSRHSFNAIADTPGALISLRAFERRAEIDEAARTVTVDGGITYAELCPVLDSAGWALANLPSVPDFTVVGAVSTATHGSGNSNRNLAAAVSAIEFVNAAGEVVRLRRGDPDFPGAVVSLGALGVVTALTVDIVPRFDIRQSVFHGLPFERVVSEFDSLMGSAYSVSLFTHWNGDLVDQVWLKALADAPPPPADFFGATAAPGESSPVMGRDPAGTTAQLGVPGPWYDRLTHARIGAIPQVGYEYQSEYFVPRQHAGAALRALKAIAAQFHPALVVAEVRTIAADDLWLSTNSGEDSVGFHFSWARDWPAVRNALVPLEAALMPFGPRPHWGKLFLMPADAFLPRYPHLPTFRTLATRHDPHGKFRNAFIEANVFGG